VSDDRHQRERTIDHLLRSGLGSARSSSASNPCVDGETLAAWSSGALTPAQAARVEEHLADCDRCQSMLAAFVRTEPIVPLPAPWWRRAQLRWLVPLATAATVAAIWVALPQRSGAPAREAPPAVAQQAPVEPRQPSAQERSDFAKPATPGPAAGAAASQTRRDAPPQEAEKRVERKEEPSRQRLAESDMRAKTTESTANEAARVPPAAPPVAAPAPMAARPADSLARDAAQSQAAFRGAAIDIQSPSGTRWRIIGGSVQRSTDAGANWQAVTLPSSAIAAGHSPLASVVWLVGGGGAIFVSTDGAAFAQVPFISTTDLVGVVAVDDRQAAVTAIDGRRFRTTDRGLNWTPQ
jgi:Putative zinc-finger